MFSGLETQATTSALPARNVPFPSLLACTIRSMDRVTVIGNGGAGKTTLSMKLAEELSLPLYHMDQIIWQPNWRRTPDDEIREQLGRIVAEPRWLIDGLGPIWSIEMRLPVADLIVFLDYPLEHCKKW